MSHLSPGDAKTSPDESLWVALAASEEHRPQILDVLLADVPHDLLRAYARWGVDPEFRWLQDYGHRFVRTYDPMRLESAMDEVEALSGSGQRDPVLAAIAVRWAELGAFEVALAIVDDMYEGKALMTALGAMAALVPPARLPDWAEAVRTTLGDERHESQRAVVWARAARRWSELDVPAAWRILERWVRSARYRTRTGLHVDLVAFAPLLARVGGPESAERLVDIVGSSWPEVGCGLREGRGRNEAVRQVPRGSGRTRFRPLGRTAPGGRTGRRRWAGSLGSGNA